MSGFIVRQWCSTLRHYDMVTPEIYENPIDFVLDLGAVKLAYDLADIGQMSESMANRLFDAFASKHKQDIITLTTHGDTHDY